MKENSDDSLIENNQTNQNINEETESQPNENQPLKDSIESKKGKEIELIKKDEEEENEEQEEEVNKKKGERIPLEILFQQKIKFEENSNKGLTGLINIGNTCFMNSALQCLSNCYELTKYFLLDFYENDINIQNKLGTGGHVATVYRKLLEDLWIDDQDYVNPSYFKKIFAHFVKRFSGYAQQDSNEFLIYLLDKIHEDLNSITEKPYIEMEEKKENQTDEEVSKIWWEKHLKRENSIIVDLFHGQFKSTISCNKCKRISISFDSYMFISLPIPSIPITENTTVLNIIDIIKNKLNTIKKNEKKIGDNPPKRKNNRRKNKKKLVTKMREEINLSKNNIEMILLTNKKKIYKIFIKNDYIFPYLQQGYELVAYENDTSNNNKENIYFYLTEYYHNYLYSLFFYPRSYLFDYPFPLNFDKSQKIFHIYKNIKEFLKELSPNSNKNSQININSKEEILNIDFDFEKINMQKEKDCGFSIYLDIYFPKHNNSFCSSLFNSGSYINYPLLEKYSSNENFINLKRQLNLEERQLRFRGNIRWR